MRSGKLVFAALASFALFVPASRSHAQIVNETFTVVIDGGSIFPGVPFGSPGPLAGQTFVGNFTYDASASAFGGPAPLLTYQFTFPYGGSPTLDQFDHSVTFSPHSLNSPGILDLFYAPAPVGSHAFGIQGGNLFHYGITSIVNSEFRGGGFGTVTYKVTPVPEPDSITLLAGMSLSGAGFLIRRRKNARNAA